MRIGFNYAEVLLLIVYTCSGLERMLIIMFLMFVQLVTAMSVFSSSLSLLLVFSTVFR